jgi:deazaflavin-dependent oxidoreductase (nitroreductase family)
MSDTKTFDSYEDLRKDYQQKQSAHRVQDWILDHLKAYIETDGATGHLFDATLGGGYVDTPVLLLTTTGRKSGRSITMPLIYGSDGDRFIIVGSNGGEPKHPAWYLNLVAQPQVHVQVAATKLTAVASTASGEERHRLWQLMSTVYPPYPDYQKRTERELPVVVLTPLAS